MTKSLFILLILFFTLDHNINYAYSDTLLDFKEYSSSLLNFDLSGDVLSRLDSNGKTKLYDKVAAISSDKDTLYYMRCSGEKWIAGFFKQNSDKSIEFDIPGKYEKLYKFAGSNNVFYYLVLPSKDNSDDTLENNPVFIRFNPDYKNFQSVEGAIDFILIDDKSLVLKDGILDYNGLLIPLLLPGKLKISGVINSRIAVISAMDGTELVDLIAEKSIYQYKDNAVPEFPEGYNLILEFGDNIPKTDAKSEIENSIYYEILIDGVEENRTETGRGELSKTFNSKLAPGKYHIIKPERWELDKGKGRYTRMNNIYQPAELKIYMPESRILKIKIEFDGTGYNINQSVLFK